MLKIGCHLSASAGFMHMAKEILSIGGNTFQFFTRNPRGGTAKPLDEADAAAFRQFAQENGILCYTEKEANQLRGCNPAFFIEYGILKKYTQEYNVRDIMIPDGVIRVGNHAFEQNRQLVSVVVPEGVTEIGSYAFNGCRSLQRIYLPSTLQKIGKFAFRGNITIKRIVMPDSVRVIDKYAFAEYNSRKNRKERTI